MGECAVYCTSLDKHVDLADCGTVDLVMRQLGPRLAILLRHLQTHITSSVTA